MTTLAEDTFTDVAATLLSAHTPTGAVPGTAWANFGSVGPNRLTIGTNRIFYNNAGFGNLCGGCLTPASAYPADYAVEADFVFETDSLANFAAVVARANSIDFACYMFRWLSSAGAWQLGRYSAGAVFTQLGSNVTYAFPTIGTTNRIKLVVSGNQISGYVDGALVVGPITDSTISAAGLAGFTYLVDTGPETDTTGIIIDNFAASDLGGGAGGGLASEDAFTFPMCVTAQPRTVLVFA